MSAALRMAGQRTMSVTGVGRGAKRARRNLTLGLAGVICGFALLGGISVAADYDTVLSTDLNNDRIELRTFERKPGHWYVRLVDLSISIHCPRGRVHYVLIEAGDVRPREVAIRGGRFRGTLRQVKFELEPFTAEGTFVISGHFGRQRANGRTLHGRISARTVGEGGTVCSGGTLFTASRGPA